MNFCAETHLGGGVVRAFVFPSAAIAWVLAFTFLQLSTKAHEDSNYTAMRVIWLESRMTSWVLNLI